MLPIELFYGKVENSDDPQQKGRLQIRLLPEMQDSNKDHLPWLIPFNGGSGANSGAIEKTVIEEGSPVWCFFNGPSFQTGWFITGVFVNTRFDYSLFSNSLSSISEGDVGEYKDLTMTRFADGTIRFHNSRTGVTGIYHSSGSYSIFTASGDVITYSKGSLKFYNNNNMIEVGSTPGITLDSSTGTIQFNGSGDNLVKYSDLASILTFLMTNLDTRIYIDPLTGFTGTVNPTHLHIAFDPQYPTKLSGMNAIDLQTS